jgi:sterol desaturase/sphingolipid hydroxylase (fatty acid hydroxylase superfamily)
VRSGKRKTSVLAVAAAAVSIVCIIHWFAPTYDLPGAGMVVDFVGRRFNQAFEGRKLDIVMLVAAGWGLEVLIVGWRNSSVFRLFFRPRRSGVLDAASFTVFLFGLTDIASIILTFGVSVGAARTVNWAVAQYGWPRIELPGEGVVSLFAGFTLYWLLVSFHGYWGHRLVHTKHFWPLHRFHHAATELNMVTALRQHPVEPVILSFLGVVSPLLLFKVSDPILFMYLVVGTFVDLLAHSQLPWSYGWVGWLVTYPRAHQIHHSIEDEHRDMNFSNCPLWDRLFGTWYKGTKAPSAYGVPDNQYEISPLRQFCFDALEFYATAAKGVRALFGRRKAPRLPIYK